MPTLPPPVMTPAELAQLMRERSDTRLLDVRTPGEFEVEYATLGRDKREVFYNSNQHDAERRHLWRVPVAGATPMQITGGDGIEWAPAPLAGGDAIAYLRSDAKTPAHAVVQIGGATSRCRQGFGNLFQAFIAGLMAISVVKLLKVVDIDHDQRNWNTGTSCLCPNLFQCHIKPATVGNIG